MAVGKGHFENEEIEEAMMAANEAIEVVRQVGNRGMEIDAVQLLVNVQHLDTLRNSAEWAPIETAEKELERCVAEGNKRGEGIMRMSLAALLYEDLPRRDLDPSQELEAEQAIYLGLHKAYTLLVETGEQQTLAECLILMAGAVLQTAPCNKTLKKPIHQAQAFAKEARLISERLQDQVGQAKAIQASSVCAFMKGSFKEGLLLGNRAVRMYRDLGRHRLELQCLVMLTRQHLDVGGPRDQDALTYAQVALGVVRSLDPAPCKDIVVVKLVVECHVARDENADALELATDAYVQAKEAENMLCLAAALDLMIWLQINENNLDNASEYINELLPIYEETNQLKSKVQLLHRAGEIQCWRKNWSEALIPLGEALEVSQTLELKDEQAAIRCMLSSIHLKLDDPKTAMSEARESRRLYENCNLHVAAAQTATLNLARAESHSADNLHRAIMTASKALRVLEQAEHPVGQISAHHLLHALYTDAGLTKDALVCIVCACRLARTINDKDLLIELLNTCAHAYITHVVEYYRTSAGKDDVEAQRGFEDGWGKALRCAMEAFQHAGRLKDMGRIATSQYTIAYVCLVDGHALEAIQQGGDALAIMQEIGAVREEAEMSMVLAKAYVITKNTAKALEHAERAKEIFDELNMEADATRAQELIIELNMPSAEHAAATANAAALAAAIAKASGSAASVVHAAEVVVKKEVDTHAIEAMVEKFAKNSIGEEDDLQWDTPLMEAGMDSLSMVSFRNDLLKQVEGVTMPATLVFEYPTMRALSDYIIEEMRGG
eukprot:NODE_784_length_2765_cov_6.636846.p1 GENE.NODE_784_length_2765_cov_6.636846~~NODE_784_length_2765_cov_6.636846.p1  ORF type:complete len:789 (-),score=280.43 NODE_784_length_2765_cov_6.636846:398-2737(-)